MLNLKFIQENKETVIERLAVKNFDAVNPLKKSSLSTTSENPYKREAVAKTGSNEYHRQRNR